MGIQKGFPEEILDQKADPISGLPQANHKEKPECSGAFEDCNRKVHKPGPPRASRACPGSWSEPCCAPYKPFLPPLERNLGTMQGPH